MPKIKGRTVTESQAAVYRVLNESGRALPDHALVPIVQHVANEHQSSSGIRTRRKELTDLGLINEVSSWVKMPSGRRARMFRAVK